MIVGGVTKANTFCPAVTLTGWLLSLQLVVDSNGFKILSVSVQVMLVAIHPPAPLNGSRYI